MSENIFSYDKESTENKELTKVPISKRSFIIRRNSPTAKEQNKREKLIDHPVYKEFFQEDNPEIDPSKITCGSKKKLWWRCSNSNVKCLHHRWDATLNSRTRKPKPRGCPFCSNRKHCPCNSLAGLYPQVASEIVTDIEIIKDWVFKNPEDHEILKNEFDTFKIAPNSGDRYLFYCSSSTNCGCHFWIAMVSKRTLVNLGVHMFDVKVVVMVIK